MKKIFGYRSFMPEYKTMGQFKDIGVDTITVMLANGYTNSGCPYTAYQPLWLSENNYDYDMVDRHVSDILAASPDANLIFYLELNPPIWWLRRFYQHYDSFFELGRVCADPEWRHDVAEYMKAIMAHVEKKYGDRVQAYIFTAGSTTEWFDYSHGEESISRYEAWKKWCLERGLPEPADIPPRSIRETCPFGKEDTFDAIRNPEPPRPHRPPGLSQARFDGNGLLRTPADNAEAVNYWKFCHELIGETVIFMAKEARKVIRKEIPLGTVYGYAVDNTPVKKVHGDYMRVYNTPELDFFIAPTTYFDRVIGGGSGSQFPVETLRLRGKHALNSCDHRTYTSRNLRTYDAWQVFWKDDAEVTAGCRREIASNLTSGCSTWWFDMTGGWWASDAAMQTIKRGKELWDLYADKPIDPVYEAVVIHQPDSSVLLNEFHPALMGFFRSPRKALNRNGIPHAFATIHDLDLLDTDRIKLYIFAQPFQFSEEELAKLREKVLKPGNTVVWFYGPGIITPEGKWDEGAVEKLCGTKFNTPGVCRAEMAEGWKSYYIHDPLDLTTDAMKEIIADSGIHRWCDQPVPVYANDTIAAVHTGEARKMDLVFPKHCRKVEDLYSGEVWEDVDRITLESPGAYTWLFKYE